MNLLIVDDEPLEVTIIQRMIEEGDYGLEEIYTACGMKQAVEIMESHQIDILLSDIQMPKGSGHDLARWAMEQELKLVFIFVTSHAVFEYAREAIRLNVKEYLLKPVIKEDLDRALSSAIELSKENYQIELNEKKAAVWNSSQNLWNQEFWRTLLFGNEDLPFSIICKRFEAYGVHYEEDRRFIPVLVSWKHKSEQERSWNSTTIEFVLKNVAAEMLWGNTDLGNIIFEQSKMLIIYERKENAEAYLFGRCKAMLQRLLSYLSICDINIYINEEDHILGLRNSVRELMQAEQNDIRKESRVILIKQAETITGSYTKPDMKLWVCELMGAHYRKSLKEIERYLQGIQQSDIQGQSVLSRFQHDFLQELYVVLEEKHIQANSIFKDEAMISMFNNAASSVRDMERWLEHLMRFLMNYAYQLERTPTIIEEVKAYIKKNLNMELSRNELAEMVYFHPDYLSHTFKKQVGISISDYILQERIKEARILLSTTNGSVSEVALEVGYANAAYFTRLFKRSTGMTPKEYRNTSGKGA